MRTSREYRALARQSMQGSYGQGLGVYLGVVFAQSILGNIFTALMGESTILIVAYSILNLIIATIIFNPLLVGLTKFFLEQSQGRVDMNNVFCAFKTNLTNVVKIGFFRDIKLILWFVPTIVIASILTSSTSLTPVVAALLPVAMLILMIPGLIKSIEYTAINYILAENPDIKSKDAFRMAKEIMTGNKWKLFRLEFSFLGWMLLGAMACGIGLYFVMPYIESAVSHFYLDAKANAGYDTQTFSEEYDANKIDNGDTFGL